MRYLKLGQHGDDVRALQNKLKVFVPEVEVDGRFGPRTERAVRIAQRRLGLFPPDGIAGPKTLGALFAQKSAKANATGQPSALTQMMGALKVAEEAILAWVKKQFAGPQVVPASIRPAVQPPCGERSISPFSRARSRLWRACGCRRRGDSSLSAMKRSLGSAIAFITPVWGVVLHSVRDTI